MNNATATVQYAGPQNDLGTIASAPEIWESADKYKTGTDVQR